MSKICITTAIDYTNDVIHIGHAYQKIVADCLARFYRLLDFKVFFITGTDEYGTTNEQAAKKSGKKPKDFVDEISQKDKEQLKSLNISFDRFIRTTDEDHRQTVVDFYKQVYQAGDIYKGEYDGLYCEGCEAYKTLTELVNGSCSLHPTRQIKKVKEINYFFRWSKYRQFLTKHIKNHPNFIIPESKRKEMLAFLKRGLDDIPVSRPRFKVGWGISVPNDVSQNIYVWFDALINYYTAASRVGFWDDKTKIIHILGKDNLRWHTLLWPAMLRSADLRLPDTVFAHGFINLEGKKISKSLGNVIRPTELVSQFGADAVRYFFLKYGPATDDVDVSVEKIKKVYNSELANDWGNLISRVAKLVQDSRFKIQGLKNAEEPPRLDTVNNDRTSEVKKYGKTRTWQVNEFSKDVIRSIQSLHIPRALENISARISKTNQFINEKEPWKKKGKELEKILGYAISQIAQIAFDLAPFMPESSEKILKQFSAKEIKFTEPYFKRI